MDFRYVWTESPIVDVWSSRSTSAAVGVASISASASASASSPSIPTICLGAGSVCTVVMTSLLVPVPVWAGVFAGARLARVVAGRLAVVRSAAFRAGAVRTVLGMRHLLPYARVTADASLGGPRVRCRRRGDGTGRNRLVL